MRKITLIVSMGILTVLMQGCFPFNLFQSQEEKVGQEAQQQISANTEASTSDSKASEIKSTKSEASKPQAAGLVPLTNPDSRVKASIKGRQDPFAQVAMKVEIKKSKEAIEREKLEALKNASTNGDASDNTSSFEPSQTPSPPEPRIAQQVTITGVADIGGMVRAIIKAPEEDSSRYVDIGQYVANGQVLVKRIDMSDPSSPVVVLEESGIEVYKKVGEPSEEKNSESKSDQASIGISPTKS